jgi:dephospho-CoA kinase
MKVFGITGGTGAGKTTALDTLAGMNVEILDCDVIYHQLVRTSEPLRAAITERFGDVFDGEGLNRQKLGNVVFQNPEALSDLNDIILGYVEDEVHRRMKLAEEDGRPGVAIDAIGMLESDVRHECDALVAITAPVEVRVRRIMDREGISEEYARNRINAQQPDSYYADNCHYVLENDSTEEKFQEKTRALFTRLLTE